MTTNTITEADVVAFLTDISKHAAAEFGGYGWAQLEVMAHRAGTIDQTVKIGAGELCVVHTGKTFADAFQSARAESKPDIAAKKRAEAARLIAEADKLEGKA
jgi:hypothetical protein